MKEERPSRDEAKKKKWWKRAGTALAIAAVAAVAILSRKTGKK